MLFVLNEIEQFCPEFIRQVSRHRPEFFCHVYDSDDASKDALKNSEILVSEPKALPKIAAQMPNLRWAHCTWAGVNALFWPTPVFDKKPLWQLTRTGGNFGKLIAEYVIGQIVSRERRFFTFHDWQKERKWYPPRYYRSLSELTIGILGVGEIGREIARVCKSFEMVVWGLSTTGKHERNSHKDFDYIRSSDGLTELLSNCDYVCSVLPETSKTIGMLGQGTLKACTDKQTVLINAGRGSVISEDELIAALDNHWLGGAILDVFEQEPLPSSSRLWQRENVVITPHMAGKSLPRQTADCFLENLRRFEQGQPLLYSADFDKHY